MNNTDAITIPQTANKLPSGSAFDVNTPLMVGALLSASCLGSHACFYSDSTILSAQGAGCKTYDHAITHLPYAFMGAVGAAILFLIAGLLAS